MSQTIWKFAVPANPFAIEIPVDAQVLTVQGQADQAQMWVLLDPDALTFPRRFVTYGTGHILPDDPGRYIGTFQVPGGMLVFHLFEEGGAL